MLELYHAHISTCSQKVRLCLAEKGLKWTGHVINFARGDHLTEDYLKLNQNGVAPTLVHDGHPIVDSSVICEYLAEKFPDQGTRLMPDSAFGRAKVREWLRYIEEVPTTAIRYPSFNILFKDVFNKRSEQERQAYIDRTPLRKDLYRQFGDTGFSEEAIESSKAKLRQTLVRMTAALSDKEWLCGEFSLADICVLPTIIRMEDIGLDTMWQDLDPIKSWLRSFRKRDSFDKAYYKEARVRPGDKNILGGKNSA